MTYSATWHAREIWREYLTVHLEDKTQGSSSESERLHIGRYLVETTG